MNAQGKRLVHIHIVEYEGFVRVYRNGRILQDFESSALKTVLAHYARSASIKDNWTLSVVYLNPSNYSECWGDTVVEDLKDTHLESPTCTLYVAGHGCEILHLKDGKFVAVNRYKRPGQARRERMLNLYHSYSECA